MGTEQEPTGKTFLDVAATKQRRKSRVNKSIADVKEPAEEQPIQAVWFAIADEEVVNIDGAAHNEAERKKGYTEVEIDNLRVTKAPVFSSKTEKKRTISEWSCVVKYEQDLWHQEPHGEFILHALSNAQAANKLGVRLNDVLKVHGLHWQQRLQLGGGRREIVHHLDVLNITISRPAPRSAKA